MVQGWLRHAALHTDGGCSYKQLCSELSLSIIDVNDTSSSVHLAFRKPMHYAVFAVFHSLLEPTECDDKRPFFGFQALMPLCSMVIVEFYGTMRGLPLHGRSAGLYSQRCHHCA